MIDYTQLAFANPVSVVDPLPSVADYLNDYRARNEAWYRSWAVPFEGGYGSRPESFQVRGPWTTDLLPPMALPPILQETGGDLATGGEAFGMGSTGQEDRPVGAVVRDPADMSNEDLWSEYQAYTDPVASYAGSVPAAALSLGVPGAGLVGGMMARQSMENRATDVMNEIGRRMGALYAPQAQAAQVMSGGGIDRATVPVQGGTSVFTGGDVFPTEYDPDSNFSGGGGRQSEYGGGGRDTYQGGEVGAGGWAGEGGL